MNQLTCMHCYKTFKPKGKKRDDLFCSNQCRSAATYRRPLQRSDGIYNVVMDLWMAHWKVGIANSLNYQPDEVAYLWHEYQRVCWRDEVTR